MRKIVLFLLIVGILWYFLPGSRPKIKNINNSNFNIVVLGDSLSYGKGASHEEAYPALLEKSLGHHVINLGVNGDTAVRGRLRVDDAVGYEPYMVLIEFGGNDLMQQVPFQQTLTAMEQMVDTVQSAGAIAVIVDTGGSSLMGRYTKEYKKLARRKGAIFVPGILNGVMGKRGLMSDQVHPNAAGYKIIAEKIEKAIKPYLK